MCVHVEALIFLCKSYNEETSIISIQLEDYTWVLACNIYKLVAIIKKKCNRINRNLYVVTMTEMLWNYLDNVEDIW